MPKTPIDLIDEKMARDGRDAFKHSSLADFLASSGRGLDRAGLTDIVNELAAADVLGYLPAISSALRDLADDDAGEFAALVAGVAGRLRTDPLQGPFTDMLADLGSDRPELAVRLARRLIAMDMPYHAAFLVGGAMRGAPAECRGMADALLRSESADSVAAGIVSLRVAWTRGGMPDAAAQIRALAPVVSRPECAESAAVDMAMGALLDVYPAASEEAGPLIEEMARRHARCRSRLAARIWRPSSPLGDEMALRCLSICIEGEPDFQTMGNVYMALAKLSKTSHDGAVKFIADCMFNDKYAGACREHALQEIGRAAPGGLTAAILARAGVNYTLDIEMSLHTITGHIAEHADPYAILDALFGALDSGDEAVVCPALRMINALATRSHDAACDDALASSMLRRLELYAKSRGIDVEQELKKERDAYLRCAAVVRRILYPPLDIDPRRVLENLEFFPALKKAFGAEWFAGGGGGPAPHPLVASLSALSRGSLEPHGSPPPDGAPGDPRRGRLEPRRDQGPFGIPAFLDRALDLLECAGLAAKGYVANMKNADQFEDTISEIALVAPFVAGRHRVELEPRVGEKRLDAAIELGAQRVLFEVLSPHVWGPLEMLEGSRKIPTNRVPGKIFDKARDQLPPPCACADPIVVAVDTSRSEADQDAIEDYVLGPRIYAIAPDNDTGEAIVVGTSRSAEESMHRRDKQTDSISAVVCFRPAMSADMPGAARGTIVENPHACVPLDAAALEAIARVLRGGPAGGVRHGGGGQ